MLINKGNNVYRIQNYKIERRTTDSAYITFSAQQEGTHLVVQGSIAINYNHQPQSLPLEISDGLSREFVFDFLMRFLKHEVFSLNELMKVYNIKIQEVSKYNRVEAIPIDIIITI